MATRVAWPVIVIFALSGTLLVFAVLNLGFNISTNKKQVPGIVSSLPPPPFLSLEDPPNQHSL